MNDSLPGQYTRLALTAAATATGGALHDASNGVGAFKSIFDDFRQSYVLRYTVTGVPTGGWHTRRRIADEFPDEFLKPHHPGSCDLF